MNKLLSVVGLGMVVCFLSACGKGQDSPKIVCDVNGMLVPTAFTFDEFKQALASEQGPVEATGYEQLKTKSLVVVFKPLENGTVLAERAIIRKTGKVESTALLFGLVDVDPAAVQTAPAATSGSNVPAASP